MTNSTASDVISWTMDLGALRDALAARGERIEAAEASGIRGHLSRLAAGTRVADLYAEDMAEAIRAAREDAAIARDRGIGR
jgi:hypothetical protein